jgi:FMN phosphatase YigB (HAD superfamily)
MYIFDLDHTLLDTNELKQDMSVVFGMSADEFANDELRWFKNESVNYNPNIHLDKLLDARRISQAEAQAIKLRLVDFLKSIDHYLKPGAADLG